MKAAILTSRGRVTTPKAIREYLRLKAGDRVVFALRDGETWIHLARTTLHDLRGSVDPHQEPEDFGAVRASVRKALASRRASGRDSNSRDG
jgi:AbrB family looped-hinge helix DNA binding protein